MVNPALPLSQKKVPFQTMVMFSTYQEIMRQAQAEQVNLSEWLSEASRRWNRVTIIEEELKLREEAITKLNEKIVDLQRELDELREARASSGENYD